ncbi:MAG: tandem-95 repeat protein [Euryarchaeota archaeon]|nr:tandem-95 repeat protein [Euryarchaeota archaeon]
MRNARHMFLGLILIASAMQLGLAGATDEGASAPRAVPRAVLGELFTATWCVYCPASDNAFHNIINNASYFPGRFTAIEWHPTNNDQYGTAETDAVINWYGVTAYPTAIFDGVSIQVGGSSQAYCETLLNNYKARIDARPATSPIKLELGAYIINGGVTYAGVNVTAVDSVSGYNNLKVKAVVVEDLQIVHNNGNLRWTPRDVLFSEDLSISQGSTKQFSATGTLGGGWTKARLGVVAYVQSQTSMEVVQSIQVTSMPEITNNQPTVASQPAPISFPEDTKYTSLDLKTVFGDPEQDPLTYSFSGANNINVTLAGSAATLTPKKDWTGQETIRFFARDPYNANAAHVDIPMTVTAVNDPPTLKKYIPDFSMVEGGQKTGLKLDDIFGDVDSSLTFTASGNDRISVQIGTGSPHPVTFTAPDLWTGKEQITFTAYDGQYSLATLVNVTVVHTNHAPTASAVPDVVMDEDTVDKSLDLTKVFTDLDGFETLAINYEIAGAHLMVSVDALSRVSLTPVPNWNGREVVTFSASDGIAPAAAVEVNVIVRPVNDAPQVRGTLERITFDEDTVYESSGSLGSLFRDIDGDPLTFTAEYDSSKLTIDFNNDWSFWITPAQNFAGKVPVTFTATDTGGLTAEYRTDVTVENINDQPYIKSFSPTSTKGVNLNEGESQTFTVEAVDNDNDPLEYTWALDNRLQDADGPEFEYSADYKSAGTHKLTLVVTDGPSRVEMSWTIKVTDVNRKPVLSLDQPLDNAVFGYGARVRLLATASDLDGDTLAYTWTDNGVVIGTLPDLTLTLKSGNHLIRCEVTDGKETVSSEVNIKVRSQPPQQSPGFEGLLLLAGIALALLVLGRRK